MRITCPRCGGNALKAEMALNALSRRDNETYVCSPCGEEEAINDFISRRDPMSEWPLGRPSKTWSDYV